MFSGAQSIITWIPEERGYCLRPLRQSLCIWLRWLQLQVGFDGRRCDFVKGYAAEYVGHYCRKSAPAWAVGERWCDAIYKNKGLAYDQDRNRQDLINW